MKPRELIRPYNWKDRKILLRDGVLYVPDYYTAHQGFSLPLWSLPEVFEKEAPVSIEYCSGNGEWIVEKALEFPNKNWVGVEKRFDRVRKIYSRRHNEGADNLFIGYGEAVTMTRHYFPEATVDEVYVNFPDPWPKGRHAKHRLITDTFASEVHRVLKPGGTITLVTDDLAYKEIIVGVFLAHPGFASLHPHPYYIDHIENYGTSYFDSLWRGLGCKIHFVQFQGVVDENCCQGDPFPIPAFGA
ncbi:tRNA (guanosine(46)-N7)-methyltransferase TrmB [Simkania negevensis]|uniref:tRNA (guanine-N(7)-)-methyltransferase n=1 Tax=Simkania negevensis TaxID=83561 RepID=A0ABS3ASD6_9BACT|nr:tRNA (guanosine(46)-N7)-methyltransferase TrmB [Simkania negevensis]